MNELIEKAKLIKCLICDVDGVLSDGLLHLDNLGNELKSFHVQDGMGLKLLMSAGIEVAVITTAINTVVDHRMKQLGIRLYYKGQVDKREAYQQLKQALAFEESSIRLHRRRLTRLSDHSTSGLGYCGCQCSPPSEGVRGLADRTARWQWWRKRSVRFTFKCTR